MILPLERAGITNDVVICVVFAVDLRDDDTVINPRDKDSAMNWGDFSLIVIRGDSPLHPDLHEGSSVGHVGVKMGV